LGHSTGSAPIESPGCSSPLRERRFRPQLPATQSESCGGHTRHSPSTSRTPALPSIINTNGRTAANRFNRVAQTARSANTAQTRWRHSAPNGSVCRARWPSVLRDTVASPTFFMARYWRRLSLMAVLLFFDRTLSLTWVSAVIQNCPVVKPCEQQIWFWT
jgi:hypothetical protein